MKLYLDMNVYNRIFDDQNQFKIRFETMAVDVIFELVEKGIHKLVWSFMLKDENGGNPYSDRRSYVEMLSYACIESVEPSQRIRDIAFEIMENSNAKAKDSLHLACAIFSGCTCFITCDDRFIKTINANMNNLASIIGNIKIMNPIEFLREEMNIDVVQ